MQPDRNSTNPGKFAASLTGASALPASRLPASHAKQLDSPNPTTTQTNQSGRSSVEFSSLLAATRAKLWLIAAAVTNDRTEADDILQEAAIVGLAKFASFTPAADIQESFERWMGQITRNLALNARRKRNRSDASIADTFRRSLTTTHPALARDSQAAAALERLLPALEDLDEAERTCLVLRVVGGLTYKAISTVTGYPEGTAMSHVFRARQHLRRRVLGVDSESSNESSGTSEGNS